eukprot:2413312-Amphidinium_carterae.1
MVVKRYIGLVPTLEWCTLCPNAAVGSRDRPGASQLPPMDTLCKPISGVLCAVKVALHHQTEEVQ